MIWPSDGNRERTCDEALILGPLALGLDVDLVVLVDPAANHPLQRLQLLVAGRGGLLGLVRHAIEQPLPVAPHKDGAILDLLRLGFRRQRFGGSVLDRHIRRDELDRLHAQVELDLRLVFEEGGELLRDGRSADDFVAGDAVEIDGLRRPGVGQGLGVVLVERLHVGLIGLANGSFVGRRFAGCPAKDQFTTAPPRTTKHSKIRFI